jgi:hypothetical protein
MNQFMLPDFREFELATQVANLSTEVANTTQAKNNNMVITIICAGLVVAGVVVYYELKLEKRDDVIQSFRMKYEVSKEA